MRITGLFPRSWANRFAGLSISLLFVAPAYAAGALTFEDLGAVGDGVHDDGAAMTEALYKRFGGLAQKQMKEYALIEGTPGKTYRFASPLTVRQQNLLFDCRGARIEATGDFAFDLTQDNSANWAQRGTIRNCAITGAKVAGIRGVASNFWKIYDNEIFGNVTGVEFTAVAAHFVGNYVHNNSGDGIVLRSARVVGGRIAEAQRNVVDRNTIYHNGGDGLRLIDGVGHAITNNDIENSGGVELHIQSSLGNQITNLYTEPLPGKTVIRIDNEQSQVPGRHADNNQIIGGIWGGGALWDVDIVAGNATLIAGVRYGSSRVHISKGAVGTTILPGTSLPIVINESSYTQDLSTFGGGWTGISPVSSTNIPVNTRPGFIDFGGAQKGQSVELMEADGAYRVSLTAVVIKGKPPTGALSPYVAAPPTSQGFSIGLQAPPGEESVVRVWYQVYR